MHGTRIVISPFPICGTVKWRDMKSVLSGLRELEIELDREETVEFLCQRHRLQRDVAERIVKMARSVDQAHALAELMR